MQGWEVLCGMCRLQGDTVMCGKLAQICTKVRVASEEQERAAIELLERHRRNGGEGMIFVQKDALLFGEDLAVPQGATHIGRFRLPAKNDIKFSFAEGSDKLALRVLTNMDFDIRELHRESAE